MSSSSREEGFSKIRAILWPIHGHEMKKFLPMGLILFFVLLMYTVGRSLKDALMITAPCSGSEVLNFLKAWIVFPSSLLFVVGYSKMSNAFSPQKLYYATLLPFLVFFAVFGFFIYPYSASLHPDPSTILALQTAYPNFKWLFPLYGVWSYSLFYTVVELWGNVGVSLLFWQFANQITQDSEAKRFYGLFGAVGNFALIAAAFVVQYFMPQNTSAVKGACKGASSTFGAGVTHLMVVFVISGLCIAWLHRYICQYNEPVQTKKKKSKPKLSLKESFKYLVSSRYLMYIALMVLCYNMSINLVEITWKGRIKDLYPNPEDYMNFTTQVSLWTGVLTILFTYGAKNFIVRFGWFTTASITPMVMIITGPLFFLFLLFPQTVSFMEVHYGISALMMAVWIGGIQNLATKASKYSFFDPTKEIAFKKGDEEIQVKGKAAVDVAGGRLGKSAGGQLQQILLIVTAGSQMTIAPYLSILIIILGLIWMWSVMGLNRDMKKLSGSKE